MTNIKKIALITVALMLTTSAFAATGTTTTAAPAVSPASASLELKSAPTLVSKTSTGVTLEWEKVAAAATYIVKYSKTSVAKSTETNPQYDNETDPVTSTGTTVENLEANTDYYFSVVAVDKDNNESDTYSDELNVKTDAAGAAVAVATTGAIVTTTTTTTTAATGAVVASSLALANVTAQDNKTIDLEFSAPLGTNPVSVKITKTTDNSDVPVAEVKPDATSPNKVQVKVATVLDANSSYSVTILNAQDANGNNIQEGVNGVKEFQTPVTLAVSPEAGALDAASLSGATASGALDASASGALNGAPILPQTGPAENIIVIVALMLSFGIVYGYRRKFAK